MELKWLANLCGGSAVEKVTPISNGVYEVQIDYIQDKLFRMPILLYSGITCNIEEAQRLALEKFKQLIEVGAV